MTSAIADFYKDKNVFVTGATGFLGKVLVEKLLRSCPEVKGIYLLIRPRGPQTVQERLNKMVECKLFDKVRHEQPTFHCKLHAIPGEMCEPDLGISQSDQGMLVSKIHILFHAAATVNFNAPLKASMQLNVVGTRYVIALCHDLKHLQVRTVSPLSSICNAYPLQTITSPSVSLPTTNHHQSICNAYPLQTITSPSVMPIPTTNHHQSICNAYPLQTITSPSVMLTHYKPSPGWCDNFSGPVQLSVAVGTGLLRFMRGKNSAYADIVPVDMTANLIIAAAWDTAVSRLETIPVYNVTSGGVNPLKWGEFSKYCAMLGTYFNKHPLDKLFRTPNITFINNSFMYQFWQIVSHKGPAYLYDIWLSMIGQKPKVWKMYEKVERALSKFEYFTSHHWEWSHDNTDALMAKMGTEDKKIFNFDYRGLHWPTYMENYVLGMKKYVLKEDMDHLPMTKARLNRLRNIPRCFNTILIVVVWRVLIARTKIARNIWHLVVSLCFKFLQYLRISSKRGH
uniref:Fatty acyl-CoA reductase n=1 Tax=Branchiostoma floridae TaxID=7739 RepID=C3XT74_BRAFL|eukprot:XP_002612798.1 hypothetical protein BRAFLDRAFT_233067 [Branchiostoma floridae]